MATSLNSLIVCFERLWAVRGPMGRPMGGRARGRRLRGAAASPDAQDDGDARDDDDATAAQSATADSSGDDLVRGHAHELIT